MKTIKAKIQELKKRLKSVTIEVKQEHIAKGIRRSPSECAIALAFGDAFKGKVHCVNKHFEPKSGELSATFTGINDNVYVECILPTAARRLASRFDNYDSVKPIKFKVSKVMSVESV